MKTPLTLEPIPKPVHRNQCRHQIGPLFWYFNLSVIKQCDGSHQIEVAKSENQKLNVLYHYNNYVVVYISSPQYNIYYNTKKRNELIHLMCTAFIICTQLQYFYCIQCLT